MRGSALCELLVVSALEAPDVAVAVAVAVAVVVVVVVAEVPALLLVDTGVAPAPPPAPSPSLVDGGSSSCAPATGGAAAGVAIT